MEKPRRSGSRRRRLGGAICAMATLVGGCASHPISPELTNRDPATPIQYMIGAGDTLDIIVWREDKISGPVQVRPDGVITVSLLGDVAAAGLTPEQLAESLRQGLARYIDRPNVVVRVAVMGSRRFFVIGKVAKPGMYDMGPEQTFLQAIATAGGFTDFANRSGVRIVRRGGGGTPVEPDYEAITRGEVPDVRIEPNDTIIVP